MRYLGLDLGTKTLGVAISDKTGNLASPLSTLRFSNEDYESLLEPINEIINKYNITNIVLGLPKNMDGSSGFAAQRSQSFKKLLEENINIPVELYDERLTSVMAHNILIENGKKTVDHKPVVDTLAAVIILEDYLKKVKK